MRLRFSPLFSGSSGNSIYVGTENTHVLIDAGLSGSRILGELQKIGVAPEQLSAIFCTHEHVDHCRGVGILSRKYGLPVYASAGTVRNCLVADNRGVGAVGLWASGSATIENVTVAGNVTTGEGVTTGVKAASSANLANVLAWGVGAAAVNAIDAGATCTTCLFDKDPIFRNAVRGDYRIKNGSPAQNAGTNLGWMQGAVDLFGNPRILDKIVDIGCYEKGLTGLAIIVR